ncbi:hypothetical protein [Maribacter polysaccharolyticus]|uniref:hypothetical protein n=1 Tax=Maribacter polysaccharolyticus TaxID=3020831 RepID=UPI00237F28E5|nr:hypothetical protein [Maribacter polysaccharolyticus]MDE3742013.1 hypothetical protein [Maribacter polysaccharolyticus]
MQKAKDVIGVKILNGVRWLFVVTSVMAVLSCGQKKTQGQRGFEQVPPPMPTTEQIEKNISDLVAEISLSNEQEVELLEIYSEHYKQVGDRLKFGRPDRREMEALRNGLENQIKGLLTKEQLESYTAYKKKIESLGLKE